MKVAVIGSGISGNTLSYLLNKNHDVTLYEKDKRIGGHSHTHEIVINNKKVNVDTGFIVFNKKTYPLFTSLLNNLGVKYENSNMSFSVFSKENNFEYNGTSLNSLFSQRRNLLSPKFLKMIFEILRFNKESIKLKSKTILLKQYLKKNNYSTYFCKNYILPMGAAIWSSDIKTILNFPAHFFIDFFKNHGMLSITKRPQWLTIKGGSQEYVKKLISGFKNKIRLNSKIKNIVRHKSYVVIEDNKSKEKFDYVFFACHSDEALEILKKPTADEVKILSALPYQKNDIILHTDSSIMPQKKLSWAAWNYNIDSPDDSPITLTYNMNILQNIKTKEPLLVTLNPKLPISKGKVIKKLQYTHPKFSKDSVSAQLKNKIISGKNRTFYSGAYWGKGFHEDGVKSAYEAVKLFEAVIK
ncbi:FAD-dependent oxidoreductase [Methylophilaceae bacterium]|nr:FAD-dependent oxidoreductase [Methylophilaceae bacterium]